MQILNGKRKTVFMDMIARTGAFLRGLPSRQAELGVDRTWLLAAFLASAIALPASYFTIKLASSIMVEHRAPLLWLLVAGMAIMPVTVILALLFSSPWLRCNPERPVLTTLGFNSPEETWWKLLRNVLLLLGAVLATATVVTLFSGAAMELFGFKPEGPQLAKLLLTCPWSVVALVAFFAVAVAPLVEEMLFRRIIFGLIGTYCGVWPALVATSALFGLVHDARVQFPALFLLGAVLQLLYLRYRSLWPSILLHAANNALAISVLLLCRCLELKLPDWV